MDKKAEAYSFMFPGVLAKNGRSYVIASEGILHYPCIKEIGMDGCGHPGHGPPESGEAFELTLDTMVWAPYLIFSDSKWYDPRQDMEQMPKKVREPLGYNSLESGEAIELTPEMAVEVPPRKSPREIGLRKWLDSARWDLERALKPPEKPEYPNAVDFDSDGVEWIKRTGCWVDVWMDTIGKGKQRQKSKRSGIHEVKRPSYNYLESDNSVGYLSPKELKEFSPDGKEVTPAVKKHTPHKIYMPRQIENINRVFEGCGDRLMADQMLRMGMVPQDVMPFLRARNTHLSMGELEGIYDGIPPEKRNTLRICDLSTYTYTNYLEELKKTFREHKYSKPLQPKPKGLNVSLG